MDEGAGKRGTRDDSWDPGLGSGWNSFITVEKTGEREILQATEELWVWLR